MIKNTTTKWHHERCPRCGGNLYQDMRTDESDFICLQCGKTFPYEVMALTAIADADSLAAQSTAR